MIILALTRIVDRVVLAKKEEEYGMNPHFFLDGDEEDLGIPIVEDDEKPRRGRPPKKRREDEVYPVDKPDKNPANSDMSYQSTYETTNQLLGNTILQIDVMGAQIQQDLAKVRSERDRKKWEYIGALSGTSTSLIGNKISAIREMNNIITKCHDLEFKRAKELRYGVDEGDDDKKLMDLYHAYINTPVGSVPGAAMPFAAMTPAEMMTSGVGIPINENIQQVSEDPGYLNYLNNMSPTQNAMIMETNPYVETVLVYDQSTQEKHFEVIDTRTGEMIPNMPVPAPMILDGTVVDIRRGTARNAQVNQNFKVKLLGERGMNEY